MPLFASLDYRLYSLGWHNRLHRTPHPLAHLLLSCCYFYRQGFDEAARWAQELAQIN